MTPRSRLFDAFASCPRPAAARIVRPESGADGDRVQEALADKTVAEISVHDVNKIFEGNLWMLTPEAFVYYLPALMDSALNQYGSVSVFASELIGALTEPSRADVVASLDRLEQVPPGLALADPTTRELLRAQQLEWFDSGTPTAIFHERFDGLTPAEGSAILAFLEAFREQHEANFPFGELDAAIDRHWARFRSS
jgi:hypothetical protein